MQLSASVAHDAELHWHAPNYPTGRTCRTWNCVDGRSASFKSSDRMFSSNSPGGRSHGMNLRYFAFAIHLHLDTNRNHVLTGPPQLTRDDTDDARFVASD